MESPSVSFSAKCQCKRLWTGASTIGASNSPFRQCPRQGLLCCTSTLSPMMECFYSFCVFLIRDVFTLVVLARCVTDRETRSRQFGRQSNKENKNNQQKAQAAQNASPTTTTPSMPSFTTSPSASSALSLGDGYGGDTYIEQEPTKFFFKEKHAANFILKGNFMTLAAQPKHVELGEWLAHQSRCLSSA